MNMKRRSRTARVLIVCAVAFVLGLAMTAAGYAMGGVSGVQKAAKDFKLISINGDGPVDTLVSVKDFDFDSIECSGSVDLIIAGSKYYQEILNEYKAEGTDAAAGKVIIISDKKKNAPAVKTEGDKLIIDAAGDNIDSKFFVPAVVVLCDDKVESIRVRSTRGDVVMAGVKFDTADIEMAAGDMECKSLISNGIRIKIDAGDVDMSGVLNGETEITDTAGDIKLAVFDAVTSYTMDLHTDAGDILVGKEIVESGTYTQKGGKDSLKLMTAAGDITVITQ